MEKLKVRIKRLSEEVVIPKYAKQGDAGMDLVATTISVDEYKNICYGTGLAFEIPEGYVGLLFPRSSNFKKNLLLSNSVGVLDSGYRGEVVFKYKLMAHPHPHVHEVGDRIGQIVIIPYPQVEFEEVEELSETERGYGGFGSTGL